MSDNELVLFIDSLDQLSDRDRARSDISFLKGVKPHLNTAIVVSCLPDEQDAGIYVAHNVDFLLKCMFVKAQTGGYITTDVILSWSHPRSLVWRLYLGAMKIKLLEYWRSCLE